MRNEHTMQKDLNAIIKTNLIKETKTHNSEGHHGLDNSLVVDYAHDKSINNNKDAEVRTMKTSRLHLRNLLLPLTVVAMLFSVACDYAATTAPESAKTSVVSAETKSLSNVKFARWSTKTMEKLRAPALFKGDEPGSDTDKVSSKKGGTVGSDDETFGNTVYFEPYSFDEKKQKITVRATCMDNDNPCAAEIEFLPSQTFNKAVLITLSYEALGYTGDPYELEIYWLQEDGSGGVITEFTIDEEAGTVSFWIDHFTRYGWAY